MIAGYLTTLKQLHLEFEGDVTLRRRRRKWEYNIKIVLKEKASIWTTFNRLRIESSGFLRIYYFAESDW
jgi:hypothetical protein